jgi:coproporphyrinogen III oxidase
MDITNSIYQIILASCILLIVGCGGDTTSDDSNTSNTDTIITTEVVTPITLPYSDTINFDGGSIGTVFVTNDGSFWEIKGVTSSSVAAGSQSFTIYETSSSMSDPHYGTTATYFMLIEGSSNTVFIEKLPDNLMYMQDTINFDGGSVGTIITTTDGSLWEIKGVTTSSVAAGSQSFTIYETSSLMADPHYGTTASYFMVIEGSSNTVFIEKLPANLMYMQDTINFEGGSIGSVFATNNGSLWEIKGVTTSSVAAGSQSFTIYETSSLMADPHYGTTASYFMVIEGSSNTVFIELI